MIPAGPSHHDPAPTDIGVTSPTVRDAFVIEESFEAVRRINRYILQLLHEDRARGGVLLSLSGLGEPSILALETLLARPWAEVEDRCRLLTSPLWRLADEPACWRALADGYPSPHDRSRVDGGLWPAPAGRHALLEKNARASSNPRRGGRP